MIKIHGVEVEAGLTYLIQEYLEGGDLAQAILKRKPNQSHAGQSLFTPLEVSWVGIQISSALAAVHAKNSQLPSVPDVGIDSGGEDLLRNTFLHLIRNSLDHGLEPGVERIERGKPAAGCLSAQASFQDQTFRLLFKDDGRGLNLVRLRELGEKHGFLKPDLPYTDEALAELIFESGLSTVQTVTQISGRGIGMGAVRKFIRDAGGKVTIKLFPDFSPLPGYMSFAFNIELPAKLFIEADEQRALKELPTSA